MARGRHARTLSSHPMLPEDFENLDRTVPRPPAPTPRETPTTTMLQAPALVESSPKPAAWWERLLKKVKKAITRRVVKRGEHQRGQARADHNAERDMLAA
ncbi:hypothetical protein Slin15195_G042100 [Septoria linicola]|uniref:Uncharacterized protein n=1 Tax=Septoria linicola TaxID=215465 RepID=A0A9Q9AUE2_9PEZI|nr:hypothetical protein Slin14017_G045610 [Septoria linicola]USW50891.1 hypothetical protein Slin15195_G042100 [Septoria linicola]